MRNWLRKIVNNKYIIIKVSFLSLVCFLIPLEPVFAQIGEFASNAVASGIAIVLGFIALIITAVLGLITTVLVKILVSVANFNNIIGVEAVEIGWVAIRDICNMSFILILLVIAFATILKVESYNAKKMLPKLLIMAVLINFSKTIFGLIIDFSQVIMLTFTNAFANGHGMFIKLFNIDVIGNIWPDTDSALTQWAVVMSIIAGVIASIVTLITVLVILAVLVYRVVMLWIYTILSPLILLGFAFPPLHKYTGRLWEDFIKHVMVGPILAFFIWLALLTASGSSEQLEQTDLSGDTGNVGGVTVGASVFFEDKNLQTYIITIALLFGGLMVTQQMGGALGSIAGKGMTLAKKSYKLPLGMADWGARKFALFKGFEVGKEGEKRRILRGFEVRPTKIYEGIKQALGDKKAREEGQVEAKAGAELRSGRLLGALGASRDFTEAAANGFMWNRAWRFGDKGVIRSTFSAGRANKKIRELEAQKQELKLKLSGDNKEEENKKISNDIEKIEAKIEEQEKAAKKFKAPYTFYADSKRNEIIAEQEKKLADNDNEDDLVEKFADAYRQGNKELASAIFIHAAKVGHSNEMLEQMPVLDNVFDSAGNLVSEKDKDNFRADAAGLRGMVKQYFVEGLGMSDQEAYTIQNIFSSHAKKANHFNLSESIGARNGLLYQRSDSEQMNRAVGEMMKMDIEQLLRRLNRLGHGGELQYMYNEAAKRVADFNQQAELTFFKTAPSMDQEVNDRQRMNSNAAQNFYNTYKIEQEIEGIGGFEPNKALEKAIIGDKLKDGGKREDIFRSIMTALEESGNGDKTYITKEGDQKKYKQLAYETLLYGQSKYEASTLSDLKARISLAKGKEREELNNEYEKEVAVGKAIKEKIESLLNEMKEKDPDYLAKKPKSDQTQESKPKRQAGFLSPDIK